MAVAGLLAACAAEDPPQVSPETVEAAVTELQRSRPDLVITDCAMPIQDGFDLIHRIKAQPELEAIPTLMVTAHANPELRDRALQEGFDAFLVKPVDPARLLVCELADGAFDGVSGPIRPDWEAA